MAAILKQGVCIVLVWVSDLDLSCIHEKTLGLITLISPLSLLSEYFHTHCLQFERDWTQDSSFPPRAPFIPSRP